MNSLAERALVNIAQAASDLPLRTLQKFGSAGGRLAGRLWWRERSTIRRNLELCFPLLDADARRGLVDANVRETSRLLFELPAVWFGSVERVLAHITAIEGEEHLQRAIASGNGLVLIAPHLGNFELLNLWLSARVPLTVLTRRLEAERTQSLLKRARERGGARVVDGSRAGIRSLLSALRRSEAVGLLPDQVPEPGMGACSVAFFGQPARTSSLAARLLAASDACVLAAAALRRVDGNFTLRIVPIELVQSRTQIEANLVSLNTAIEALILEAPAQYLWAYKRFKHAVPGTDLYRPRATA